MRMGYRRACEINSHCLALSYARMGIELSDVKDPSITGYTLEELITAPKVIRRHEDRQPKKPGGQTITVICDDRLLAALYACENYDAGHDARHLEPIAIIGKKALVVAPITPELFAPDED